MQKGIIIYRLLCNGWDVSDHYGDGYDLVAEKDGKYVKIEIKAIDLSMIKNGKRATQYLSVNELVSSSHLIITVFRGINVENNYVMSIRDFVEKSDVKKYKEYNGYDEFQEKYKELAVDKLKQVKGSTGTKNRLAFDFNFDPKKIEKWKFSEFKEKWDCLEK